VSISEVFSAIDNLPYSKLMENILYYREKQENKKVELIQRIINS
jgi:hypothetical protein